MKINQDITRLIGKTPLIRLNRLSEGIDALILAKMESMNPGGSVKDRLALAMIEAAEAAGLVDKETFVVEPTSGNTGIGLAMVCAVKGYSLTIVMPESASLERRILISAYGASVVLSSAAGGMKEAIAKTKELASMHSKSFIPMQFSNPANARTHMENTGPEIWEQTDGQVDIFVAASGTGGTITGVSTFLKGKNPRLKSIVVEPSASPVLSGGEPGKHKIQGIGPGFVPEVLNLDIIDEIFQVTDDQAFEFARKLAIQEGILAGVSSGANCYAALETAKKPENKGKTIVFIVCDTGERYLSTSLFKHNHHE